MARSGRIVAIAFTLLTIAAPVPAQEAADDAAAMPAITICTVDGEQRELPSGTDEDCDPNKPVYTVYDPETLTDIPPPIVPKGLKQSTEGGSD